MEEKDLDYRIMQKKNKNKVNKQDLEIILKHNILKITRMMNINLILSKMILLLTITINLNKKNNSNNNPKHNLKFNKMLI